MTSIEARVSALERELRGLRYERETLRGLVDGVGAAVDMTYAAVKAVEGKVDLLHEQGQSLDTKFDGLRDELAEQRGMLEQILRRLPILPLER